MAGAKVEIEGLALTGAKVFFTGYVEVPSIVAAVAYVAADAMGRKFSFDVPKSGIIHTAVMLDKDDEGIETDLVVFVGDFTDTADNTAFDVLDSDLHKFLSTITFATFKNFASNQVSSAAALGLAYVAPEGKLWCQMVTRGTPNIAANASPMVGLTILASE